MEMEQAPHPDYLKGFNRGYELTKCAPDISDQVTPYLNDGEMGKGFTDGKSQFEKEKQIQRVPSFLEDIDKAESKDEMGLSMDFTDKGDVEPDKE